MNLKVLVAAAGIAAAPLAADAATINGQIDITGLINGATSVFDPAHAGTDVFFTGNGSVAYASGSFAGSGPTATLFNIDFSLPSAIYTVGAFTFTALTFGNFSNSGLIRGFSATGVLSAAGYTNTPGSLLFSTQGTRVVASFSSSTSAVPLPAAGFLLLGGLGGLAALRRRRKSA